MTYYTVIYYNKIPELSIVKYQSSQLAATPVFLAFIVFDTLLFFKYLVIIIPTNM